MAESFNPIELGFLVGFFPAISMLGASLFLAHYEVSLHTEACFQNFCAGLIISATANELFPLLTNDATEAQSAAGECLGFILGLGLILGINHLIANIALAEKHPKSGTGPFQLDTGSDSDWDVDQLGKSSEALTISSHREHLVEHLQELLSSVKAVELTSYSTLCQSLSHTDSEAAAEKIDEEIHSLQYKLDHCRRLLQGSESGLGLSRALSEDEKIAMQKKLRELSDVLQHMLDHVISDEITAETLKEIYGHMGETEEYLKQLHLTVEETASHWRRSRPFPSTRLGEEIPSKLVLPVLIDGFVDGFLIGITCAISPTAGFILGGANSLEMAFLGMAYSARIFKCTGSSTTHRYIAVVAPPLIMFVASGLGAVVGGAALSIPIIYIAIVSFGIVALLYLVCVELLIEARAVQGGQDIWWITSLIFAGILVVLLLEHALPKE